MQNLVIPLVLAIIGLFIFYLIIKSATGTEKKIELLKEINERNKKIEILFDHLVSVKAPIQKLQQENKDFYDVDDYFLLASNVVKEIVLAKQISGESIDSDKFYKLGKIRNLYMDKIAKDGGSATDSAKKYNELISRLQENLTSKEKTIFIENYNKGING